MSQGTSRSQVTLSTKVVPSISCALLTERAKMEMDPIEKCLLYKHCPSATEGKTFQTLGV